ncbi:MAG: permease [Bacteroidales bacterium]
MSLVIDYLVLYLKELASLTYAMAPYLMLGFIFAGILHVFFKKEKIARLLGSKKVKSSVYASLIGVPLPLCSCGVIPTGVSFYKNGASKSSTVSFLISTPQTGVDSIMATYSMLGLPFAVLRPLIAFISGVVGGAFTSYIDRNSVDEPVKQLDIKQETKKRNPVFQIIYYAFYEFLQDIAKWLIIGLLLAAFISLIIPDNFFQEFIHNDFLSMLVVLAVSVPLYVCATGSIPIAAVLIMKGISPGAAFVFLMAGPATNAATITVLGKVIGKKALFGYLASIIGSALFFGFIIDQFLPRGWFAINHIHHHHDMNHGLPVWLQILSSALLVIFILNIYFIRYIKNKKPRLLSGLYKNLLFNPLESPENNQSFTDNRYQIVVNGMNCNHCKVNVENTLQSIPGITSVNVLLDKSTASFNCDSPDMKLIKEKIESVGFEFGGVVNK